MIELRHVHKHFQVKDHRVDAVKDVSLVIADQQIFGVIGYSGAGKSTLVRCINLLERPDRGQVLIDQTDLTKLNDRQLRKQRNKIGMIFQQFNLLKARTVYENVAFPLRHRGQSRAQIDTRVRELLALTGIADKANSYPSQLSGGQKQRVAIARALANNPSVLLCDEATSALDPQTTRQILALLRDLRDRLHLTIVIITHDISVVKEICDEVAVMEDGQVVEQATTSQLFAKPKARITQEFIRTTSSLDRALKLLDEHPDTLDLNEDEQLIILGFGGPLTKEALISRISRQFDQDLSILFGNVEVIGTTILGSLIVRIQGDEATRLAIRKAFENEGVRVEVLAV